VIAPGRNDLPSIGQIPEPVLAEATIAEATVEAFDERVLRRFTGLNEVQLHAVLSTPEEHRLAGHLGTIVEHQRLG